MSPSDLRPTSDEADSGSFISLVTPFYNEARYLAECVDSVLAQTHTRFEYILVDNCSTDGSGVMADEYARRDSRIRVIHNERLLPQLENFNLALRQIDPRAKYVKMVLGDDLIFPECVERMVSVAEAHPSIGLVASYFLYWDNQALGGGLPYPSPFVPGRELCRQQMLEGRFFFGTPTVVLFRAELVRARSKFFTETSLHADTEVAYELLESHDFGFVHQVLSVLRVGNPSTLTRVASYHWVVLDKYLQLRKYGPRFLSPAEFGAQMRRVAGNYWGMLGEAALFWREAGFWEYHRRGLATAGESLRFRSLVPFFLLALARAILHPRTTVTQVRDRLALRARSPSKS